jgi:hypothetical protein
MWAVGPVSLSISKADQEHTGRGRSPIGPTGQPQEGGSSPSGERSRVSAGVYRYVSGSCSPPGELAGGSWIVMVCSVPDALSLG